LDRRDEKNGHTHYSLTKRFRAILEREMKHAQPPTMRYLRNAFAWFDMNKVKSFGKEKVSPMDYHSGNYRIGRKRKTEMKS
jgi:hypothetical protein